MWLLLQGWQDSCLHDAYCILAPLLCPTHQSLAMLLSPPVSLLFQIAEVVLHYSTSMHSSEIKSDVQLICFHIDWSLVPGQVRLVVKDCFHLVWLDRLPFKVTLILMLMVMSQKRSGFAKAVWL